MSNQRIYNYTSIARPLDPAWPSNRAVLFLVPALAIGCAVSAWLGWSALISPGSAALAGALVAFGTWAVTRELAPDDDLAAFISMLLGVIALLAMGQSSVLPVFVCLVLVRVVNRSTGKPLTSIDLLLVLGFVLWSRYALQQPFLPFVAAFAFVLDGTLAVANRRSLAAGAICLAAPVVDAAINGMPAVSFASPPATDSLLIAVILVAYLGAIVRQKTVVSAGDVGGERLSTTRVQMGMMVAVLLALQALFAELRGSDANPFVWACLAGTVLGRLLPRRSD